MRFCNEDLQKGTDLANQPAKETGNMSYIIFLRQLRHLPSSFSIFPSLAVKVGLVTTEVP